MKIGDSILENEELRLMRLKDICRDIGKKNQLGRGQKTLNPVSSRTKEKRYLEPMKKVNELVTLPLYDHPATMSERYMIDNHNAVINQVTLKEG